MSNLPPNVVLQVRTQDMQLLVAFVNNGGRVGPNFALDTSQLNYPALQQAMGFNTMGMTHQRVNRMVHQINDAVQASLPLPGQPGGQGGGSGGGPGGDSGDGSGGGPSSGSPPKRGNSRGRGPRRGSTSRLEPYSKFNLTRNLSMPLVRFSFSSFNKIRTRTCPFC